MKVIIAPKTRVPEMRVVFLILINNRIKAIKPTTRIINILNILSTKVANATFEVLDFKAMFRARYSPARKGVTIPAEKP